MTIFKVKGFPDRITKPLPLPGIAELMFSPFFARADAEYFYKNATDFQRRLLDSCDISNKNYRHITVDSYLQVLHPHSCAINIRMQKGFVNEWHFDGKGREEDGVESQSTFHILQNECSANTVFNEVPFEVDITGDLKYYDILYQLNSRADELFTPKKMPANSFVTFTDHLHNSVSPIEREFRYFMRITESNDIKPRGAEESYGLISGSLIDFIGEQGETVKVICVDKKENGIFIPNYNKHGKRE